jgi:PTS system mannose-specific IID component
MIAVGGLGVIFALIVTGITHKDPPMDEMGFDDIPDETATVKKKMVTKGDLRRVFVRSLALEANFNFETWQNTGFAFSIIPVLKKLYTTKEKMSQALKRHLQFFNTTAHGSTLILGITAAMEEQNNQQDDFEEESINTVKTGLMGPLAGVFDSLFWGTLKVIAAGVGISLAINGNIMGPLLFLLIFNIPHILLRYNLTFIGYNTGNKFLQNLAESNVMDKLTTGASILGLMVIGAMPAILMPITTPLKIGTAESQVAIQSILDQLVPNMLPLALTFLAFYLVRRNIKTTWLLLGILVLGFVGSILHIFS